jgi:murein DD-endopeptidase MepM/ murein hydrolase activator NlpD
MARRKQWTFMLIAEGETRTRQVRLSREMVQIGIAAVLLIVAGFSSLATGLLVRDSASNADTRLVRSNSMLRSELTGLNSKVDTLRSSLESLYAKDEQYRLLAGLTPLDSGVMKVGIGGPGSETAEDHPLFSVDPVSARRTFSTSSEIGALIRRARLLSFSWREAEDTLSEKHNRLESMPSITPTHGYITSGFTKARMHPLLGFARPHKGLDIVANIGTPIMAAAKGRVRFVGRDKDYGLVVEIDHGYGLVTRYAHTSATLVHTGQQVERGDTIARVGQSGLAVGPHLHYEVIQNGKQTDPRKFLLDLSVVPD